MTFALMMIIDLLGCSAVFPLSEEVDETTPNVTLVETS